MSVGRTPGHFAGLSLVLFAASHWGASVLANGLVLAQPWMQAFRDTWQYHASDAGELAMYAAPFLMIAVLATVLDVKGRREEARVVFGFSIAALAAVLIWGHWSSAQAMLQRRWTSAALSMGMVPFASTIIAALAATATVVAFLRARKR